MEWFSNHKDLIASFSSIVTALGVVVVAIQAWIARQQFKGDHERSRRHLAIQVTKDWNDSLDKSLSSARAFVQELSLEQCKAMIKREPIRVPKKYENYLRYALNDLDCGNSELDIQGNDILLDSKQISHLLALVIKHLNHLEIALLAWMNGIADKDIIESQFKYLVSSNNGYYMLENLRSAMAGKASYPAITCFVEHLNKKNNTDKSKPSIA